MTDKILYVLNLICEKEKTGKKKVQKLFYIIERKGFDLGLEYKMHFYGPYSSDLEHLIHYYESNNFLSIDSCGSSHLIRVNRQKNKMFKNNPLSDNESNIVKSTLQLYEEKTPLELEVLTTTDYVFCNLIPDAGEKDKLTIKRVKEIKGNKFSDEQIADCIDEINRNLS